MRNASRLLLAAALALALPATAVDVYDDGDPIPADKGVLILKVERERTHHGAVARRGASQIELRQLGADERVSFSTPTRLKAILLPPGRYFLYSLREVEGGMDATGITTAGESFLVEAGKASWVGNIKLQIGASGVRVRIDQGDDELADLKDRFKKLFATGLIFRVLMGSEMSPIEPPKSP